MFGGRIVRVNAGGRLFQTFASTLLKFPNSQFGRNIQQSITALEPSLPTRSVDDNTTLGAHVSPSTSTPTASLLHATTTTSLSEVPELFLDVNPDVFDLIMSFLRTGRMVLPTTNEPLRSEVMHFLSKEGLMEYAFGVSNNGVSSSGDGGDGDELVDQHNAVILPDVCVVQLCDHMQHDQGVKRHAITMSYGADGFQLRDLAKRIRKDLQTQLASTFWQVYQTNERSAFFVTTKVANGTADLMTTSISQQVINHTESMGYSLTNSYVTLSPDIVHTNVRMLVHNLIFRRVRLAVPDAGDALAVLEEVESEQQRGEEEEEGDDGEVRRRRRGPEGDEAVHPSLQVHPNFEPPAVGPQSSMWKDAPTTVPTGQRMKNIWGE